MLEISLLSRDGNISDSVCTWLFSEVTSGKAALDVDGLVVETDGIKFRTPEDVTLSSSSLEIHSIYRY